MCPLASAEESDHLGEQGQSAAGQTLGPEERTVAGYVARAQEHRDGREVERERQLAGNRLEGSPSQVVRSAKLESGGADLQRSQERGVERGMASEPRGPVLQRR